MSSPASVCNRNHLVAHQFRLHLAPLLAVSGDSVLCADTLCVCACVLYWLSPPFLLSLFLFSFFLFYYFYTSSMSGNNIKVVCRFRPQNSLEIREGGVPIIDIGDEGSSLELKVTDMSTPYTRIQCSSEWVPYYRARISKATLHSIRCMAATRHKKTCLTIPSRVLSMVIWAQQDAYIHDTFIS